MKKIFVLLTVFALSAPLNATVFINTIPMNAEVYLDGELMGTSPLLVSEELSGDHEIEFVKENYSDYTLDLSLSGGSTNLSFFLTPDKFSIYFPGMTSVYINGEEYDNANINTLPTGFYFFESGEDYVSMTSQNPNDKYLWASAGITLAGILAGVTGQIIANDTFESFQSSADYQTALESLNKTMFWDNLSTVGFSLAGAGAGASLYFYFDHKRFKNATDGIEIESQAEEETDSGLYEMAMSYASASQDDLAIETYTQILSDYPDSKYLPLSLYRRAILYKDAGNAELAIQDLTRIRDEYPIYDIYSLTLASLAEIYVIQQDYENAVEIYSQIGEIDEDSKMEADYSIIMLYFELALSEPDNTEYSDLLSEYASDFVENPDYDDSYKDDVRAFIK